MKIEIPIRPFWYSDIWIFPKLITIITTLDKQGRVNAAPYSHIMQYDVMHKNPRMYLGFRLTSHTYENIAATGEFVINCPPADYLEDLMETAVFHDEGVCELDNTRFTQIPSLKVKPPSLEECGQIMECTVDQIYELEHPRQGHVIAKIEAIVVDEGHEKMSRAERIKALNMPIGMGDERRTDYFYTFADRLVMHKLEDPPSAVAMGEKIPTTMEWDHDALEAIKPIPPGVRKMIIPQVEDIAKRASAKRVTNEHYLQMMKESDMDEAILERFRSGG